MATGCLAFETSIIKLQLSTAHQTEQQYARVCTQTLGPIDPAGPVDINPIGFGSCGREDPAPILERVMAEEAEFREYCKREREFDAIDGSGKKTSTPEWEYERYRKSRYRPIHELLRGWCGHRSVTFVERLTAAEAEVRRLDILIARMVDALRVHHQFDADHFEREHNEERIRPETVRPVVDRSLAPMGDTCA